MDCLCQPCQDMLDFTMMSNRDWWSDRIDLNFKTWCESATAGSCHLCTQLFYAVAGPHYQKFIDEFDAATYQVGFAVGSGNSGKYVRFTDGSERKSLAIAETLSLNSQQFHHRHQLAKAIGASTVTPQTLKQVSQWMEKCSNEHECQQYQRLASVHLPLRLIDVDPNGDYLGDNLWETNFDGLCCEKATQFCIKHSQDVLTINSNGVKYLTLSHRWGDMAPTALTWENMAEFSNQIPIGSLSKTFKDAIQVTRCLGFRYLWIDSICINQADSIEKASEISRMRSIYQSSQLNLSATSGEVGLIFPRDPKSVLPILLKSKKTEFGTGEAGRGEYLVVSAGPWETFVELGGLNTRAWVVQERFLAPRVLHFCRNMVYWECSCLRASEVDSLGEMDHEKITGSIDLRVNVKRNSVDTTKTKIDTGQGCKTSLSTAHFQAFHRLLRSHYCSKQLTYSSDRLPAISGIARWFMARIGLSSESYLAGLWREALPESLLWHLCDLLKGEAVRDLNAAPSWSWASVFAPSILMVIGHHDHESLHPLFQDISSTIVPRNEDRFGQLDVAILRLQASVIPIEREFRNGTLQIRLPGEGKWYKEWHGFDSVPVTTFWEKLERDVPRLCHRLGLISFEQLFFLLCKTTTRSYVQMRWDTTDMLWTNEGYRPSQLYMVPIAWNLNKKCPADATPRNLVIQGLILRRLSGKGQYERVGMFMTSQYRQIRNADLAQDIVRCMPNKAIDSLSGGAFKQLGNEWPFGIPSSFGLLKSRHRLGNFKTVASLLRAEDHMGVNSDGMSLIEIL